MLRGVGGRLRHVGVAVGGVEEAEGGWRAGGGGGDQRRQVGVGVAAEHEAAEGVAVGQDDHRLHQLGQRPALLARLQQRLNTKTGQRRSQSGGPRIPPLPPPLPLLATIHFRWMLEISGERPCWACILHNKSIQCFELVDNRHI